MQRGRFVFLIVCAAYAGGCDSSIELEADPNPVPILVATEPAIVTPAGATTTMRILGYGFVDGAELVWNGGPRPTTFVDETSITVDLTAEDLATVGEATVTVTNPGPGGGMSEPLGVMVGYPVPSAASLSPPTAESVVNQELALHVFGSGFATGSDTAQVAWDGVPLETQGVGPTELIAMVPDYLLRRGGVARVTVINPAPGGGNSNALDFDLVNPAPVLSESMPAGLRVGVGGSLLLSGAGFVDGIVVSYAGQTLTPRFTDGSYLQVIVPSDPSVRGDTIGVTVVNPNPGGGVSNLLDIPIWEPVPNLNRLDPRWAYVSSQPVITLHGEDFAPDATVTWDGQPHAVTFVSSTRLEITVEPSDVSTEGPISVVAINPRNGGPTSSRTLTVLPPFVLPDGIVLTEVSGGVELVLSKLDGTQRQAFPITEGYGGFRPDPSPLGGIVALHRSVREGFDIADRLFILDLTDGSVRRLLDSTAEAFLDYEMWPRFTGDGQWIYFSARERASQQWVAWRVRPDGSDAGPASTLFPDPEQYNVYPSTAGDRLVYTPYGGEAKTFDFVSGATVPLGVDAIWARWSPGDARIAFVGEDSRLRIIRSDGTDLSEPAHGVTFGPVFDWLSDGEHIVATTPTGEPVLLTVSVGKIDPLPALGTVGSIVWYADP